MAVDLQLSDLTRLDRIRQTLAAQDANEQFAALGMHRLVIDDDALDELVAAVVDRLNNAGRAADARARICVMSDPVPIMRAGQDLKQHVTATLATHFDVHRVVLSDGHPTLHADDAVLDEGARMAAGMDCIVSVGSGTLTDVAKIAAQRADVPIHVVVQTAASVDGFTDNFSVVLQEGVKRTLLTRWPDVVLTDVRTLAEAPHRLNASGFGELLSMYSAPGDWYIAQTCGMDDSFAPVLIDLLALCGEGLEEWSSGVGQREMKAFRRLAAALAMRGIVTGVGGTTASLSGMEHLISHMLDMYRTERGETMGLHGSQVGVGSVIAASAWEVFCERMEETRLSVDTLFGDVDAWRPRVEKAFAELDPSGNVGMACWGHYRAKLVKWAAARPTVTEFFNDWSHHRGKRNEIVLDSHALAKNLSAAQAVMRFDSLDPSPSPELMRWAVSNCQFMRERFTVADLLTLAGWWDDAGVERVLARAESACSAAEYGAAASLS